MGAEEEEEADTCCEAALIEEGVVGGQESTVDQCHTKIVRSLRIGALLRTESRLQTEPALGGMATHRL